MANSSLKARVAALEARLRHVGGSRSSSAQLAEIAERDAFIDQVCEAVGSLEAFVCRIAAGEATERDRELAARAPESMLPECGERTSFDEWVRITARLSDAF